jgi:hypothetical protein
VHGQPHVCHCADHWRDAGMHLDVQQRELAGRDIAERERGGWWAA